MYCVDVHIWIHTIELLTTYSGLREVYWTMGLIWISAILKETLFGFLLYITFLTSQTKKEHMHLIDALIHIYIVDVLQITQWRKDELKELLHYQISYYAHLLSLWIKLDDNGQFFAIAYENRQFFIAGKTVDTIMHTVSWEDVVWLRGFFKTITYYNRRFVKPS
jgi:hypothetical protein